MSGGNNQLESERNSQQLRQASSSGACRHIVTDIAGHRNVLFQKDSPRPRASEGNGPKGCFRSAAALEKKQTDIKVITYCL